MLSAKALAVGALLWSAPSEAPETDAPLMEWSGPAQCPDRQALLDEVDSLLEIPLSPDTTQYRFRLDIEARGSTFHARLQLRSPNGDSERSLSHDDCAQLSRGIALVMALAITEGRAAEPPAEVEVPAEPEPKPEPEPSPPPEPAPSRASLRGVLSPRVGLATGVLPGVGADLDLAAGLAIGSARVTLGGSYGLPRTLAVDPEADTADARFQRWSIAARGGYGWRWRRLGLRLEAGAELGQILAEAPQLREAAPVRALWAAALVAPTFVVTLHPAVHLDLGVEVPIALRRPAFTVDGQTLVFQPSAVGARAFLGLTIELGAKIKKSPEANMELGAGGHE